MRGARPWSQKTTGVAMKRSFVPVAGVFGGGGDHVL